MFESVFLSNRIVVMAARPGRVFAELAVDAPYPRDEAFRTSPDYAALCRAGLGRAGRRDQRDAGASAMTAIDEAARRLDPEEARRVRAERLERHRQMACCRSLIMLLAIWLWDRHLRLERDPAIHPAAAGRGAATLVHRLAAAVRLAAGDACASPSSAWPWP